MKQYTKRDFLDLIGHQAERLLWHVIRDDGVYLREPDEMDIRLERARVANPVRHPTGEPSKPALPFPFTLPQFLAFLRTVPLVSEMTDEELQEVAECNPQAFELAQAGRMTEAVASAKKAKGGNAGSMTLSNGYLLPDDRTVYGIDEALRITSGAVHPDALTSDEFKPALRREITRIEHREELERRATAGEVQILNCTTRMPLRMTLTGDALERACIARDELQRFARAYLGAALHVPDEALQRAKRRAAGRYTLEEIARELAEHSGNRMEAILARLEGEAGKGNFPMYEPGATMSFRHGKEGAPTVVRTFYEEVRGKDINKWLADNEPLISYRFAEEPSEPARRAAEPSTPQATVAPVRSDAGADASAIDGAPDGRSLTVAQWHRLARETGEAIFAADSARDEYPSQSDIAERIAKDWRKRGIKGAQGKPLSAETIKREALKGITAGAPPFNPMRGKRGERGNVEP